MTYAVEVEYKECMVTYLFDYNAKEQREFQMVDRFVGYSVIYRPFFNRIGDWGITKDLLKKICLRYIQEHIEGVLCDLQPHLQLIVDIPNGFTPEQDKVYQDCKKLLDPFRYSLV